MKKDVKKVFEEIDKAMLSSIKNKPTPFLKSDFLKKYNEIKKRFQ